jgi:transglutaminase-like putative cysteine protease
MMATSTRWATAALVLASLATHGAWHDRRFFSAAVGLVLLACAVLRVTVKHRGVVMLIVGALGGVVGGVLGTFQEPPPGPIPPGLLGVLTAALAAMATWCAVSGQVMYAGTYAWLLALLSLNGEPTLEGEGALVLLGAATMGLVVVQARLHRAGGRAALALGLMLAAAPLAAVGFTQAAFAAEGNLTNALYRVIRGLHLPGGLGLSHSIRLAATSTLGISDRPLLELDVVTPRLRSQVMDTFDGETWHTSAPMRRNLPGLPPPAGGESNIGVMLLEDLQDALPAPAGIRRVEGVNPRVVGGYVMRTTLGRGARLGLWVGQDQLPEEPKPTLPSLLAVPETLASELEAFTRGVATGAVGGRAQAQALEAWFQEEFTYSLEVDLRGPAHPLLMLLREKRPAYCIYYAGVMALMLRTLDIPTRVVGGFVPEEVNPLTQRALVRERDAHAWVEAWLEEEQRWVPFDPTPWRARQDALGLGATPGVFGALVGAVVGYVRRAWVTLREDPVLALQLLAENPLVLLAFAVALAWLGRRLWRARAKGAPVALAAQNLPRELARLHSRYLKALHTKAGLRMLPSETDDEFLTRLGQRAPDHAVLAAAFVDAWRRLRFGGEPAARADVEARLRTLER